ncbi:response regulator transcription factor [Kineosporia babensis]|uniref:LuxR C-terminal-related transcriptional regulator n=1 Tax=Kineosporia babensis TaxID=499548 RepID=A0A9X1SZ16_9ACTN|nr:LuxR C-terminal-related transcriptional regulator [Kineosporia babensis]MCD5316930.1 LuxR C-terminal-related transcriptional regulator [Kineosporia babensis]
MTTDTAARLEEVRHTFARLRCQAGATSDPEQKDRLHRMSAKLLEGAPPVAKSSFYPQHLTGREIDVLAVVGVGATNNEAAQRLGVSTETVKGYLRTAMHKLQATNRYSAVQSARRLRLIP